MVELQHGLRAATVGLDLEIGAAEDNKRLHLGVPPVDLQILVLGSSDWWRYVRMMLGCGVYVPRRSWVVYRGYGCSDGGYSPHQLRRRRS